MSPVLPPERRPAKCECSPPPLALMRCPEGYAYAIGTTWDCPACSRVWIVKEAPPVRRRWGSGFQSGGRTWAPASFRDWRAHHARLAAGEHHTSHLTAAELAASDDD